MSINVKKAKMLAVSLYLHGLEDAAALVARKAKKKASGGVAVAKGSVLPKEEPKKEIWDDGFFERMMKKLQDSPVFKELEKKALFPANKGMQPYSSKPLFISSMLPGADWGEVLKQFQPVVASASFPANSLSNPNPPQKNP